MDIISRINRWMMLLLAVSVFSIAYNVYIYFSYDNFSTGLYFVWIYSFIYLIGALAGIICIKKVPNIVGNIKWMFYGFVLNALSMAVGLFFWGYYTVVKGVDAPYPSLADFAFILTSVASLIVLVTIMNLYRIQITWKRVLEFLIYFVISSAIIFSIIGEGIEYIFTGFPYVDSGGSFWINIFDIFWSFTDAATASIALTILRVSGGKLFRGLMFYVLGMFAVVAADLIFSYRLANDILWNGDLNDTAFMVAGILYSVGILYTLKDFAQKKISL